MAPRGPRCGFKLNTSFDSDWRQRSAADDVAGRELSEWVFNQRNLLSARGQRHGQVRARLAGADHGDAELEDGLAFAHVIIPWTYVALSIRLDGSNVRRQNVWCNSGLEGRVQSTYQAVQYQITDNLQMEWLNLVKWDADGLVPVIAQEQNSKDILMFAWMNREALEQTAESGRAVYFSRSRKRLWAKGESSGHTQTVHEIRLDCDNDVVMLQVTQHGHFDPVSGSEGPAIACHTGRHSCFFQRLEAGRWVAVDPVLKDPDSIYT
jgi:phosphoribosyl-AMP cyclohydrolase